MINRNIKILLYCLPLLILPLLAVLRNMRQEGRLMKKKETVKVFVQKVSKDRLEETLVFPAMVEAFNTFPQQAFFRGIVHEVAVKIGSYVQENMPIYKMQQIKPGQEFLSSWVRSINRGTVVSINVSEGEEIAQNTVVLTVADTSRFRAILPVNPRDIDKIKLDMPVFLMDEEEKIIDIGAKITLIPMISDTKTHLFNVEAEIPQNINLYPGKMEDFVLLVDPFEGISVPQELIVQRAGRPTVTIVREGKIIYQPVELGTLYGHSQAILSGLNENDVYIVSSSRRYHEGEKAIIQNLENIEQSNAAIAAPKSPVADIPSDTKLPWFVRYLVLNA